MRERKIALNRNEDKFAFFVAFFVPAIFLSNLSGAVTEFGYGLVNYHSYILVILLYFVLFLKSGQARFLITRESMSFIYFYTFFMVVCLVSLLVVSNEDVSTDAFMRYAWMALICVGLVISFRHRKMIKYAQLGVFTSFLIICFFNIYEFINPDFRFYAEAIGEEGEDIVVGQVARIAGIYPDQNASAYAIVFCLYLLSFTLNRVAMVVLIFMGLLPVIVTFSRSGLVAWILMLGLVFSSRRNGGINMIGVLISLLLVSAVSYITLSGQLVVIMESFGLADNMNQSMRDRISGNLFGQSDNSSLQRMSIAARALDTFASNPLFGIGLGEFYEDSSDETRSHNMFLQLGSELGVLGICSYLGLLVLPFIQRFWFGAGFVLLVLAVSFFSHTLLADPWFMISATLALVLYPISKRWEEDEFSQRGRHRSRRSSGSKSRIRRGRARRRIVSD